MSYRPLISKIRVYNPNKHGSSSANRNYVQYIATRDGVSLENVNSINDLLNVTNQVEINEELIYRETSDSDYVEYIARRPRSHGLFGNIDTDDLKEVSSQIYKKSQEGKIIYRGIISLGEKDAEALGYRNVEAWNQYLQKVMPDVAEKLGVSVADHTWVAAFHAEESHPHVHYMLWDNKDRIKSPFIHTATQQNIRTYLQEQMFDDAYERAVKQACKEELEAIYAVRNAERKFLLSETADVLKDILYVPGVEYEHLPSRPSKEYLRSIADEVQKLIADLPGRGSFKYQYMTPAVKEQVDRVLDRILDKSDIKASLQCYLQKVEEGQRLQGKTKSEIKIECMKAERDVRRRLGNKILDAIHNSIRMEEGNRVPLDSEELSDGGNRVPLDSEELSDGGNRVPLGSEELLDGGNRVPLDSEELSDGGNRVPLDREELSDGGNRVPSMKQSNDIVKMIKDFTKLADSPDGNVYAAYRLGCIYMDKEDPEHYDAEKAIGYLEKAADSPDGNVYAAYRLGCIYMDKEDPEHYDTEKAIAYLEKAVENPEGNIYAAYRLGCIYMDKEDPEHYDAEKAIRYLEKAADSTDGNVYAAYRLGCIYMDKEDPEHYDAEKAIGYLEKAAENPEGNVYAAYRLGCIYMDKEDPEHCDIEKAIGYLEKAAENSEGNAYADYRLGCIYMDETMPESCNLQKGIQFLEKAALQHNPDAEIKLGIAYYFGKGVLKDKERGEQYLQAAIADGSEYAQNILDAGGLNVAYCLTKSVLSGLETMNRQQTYYNNQQSHSRQALREKQLHSDQNRDI
ncbi:MobP3 family relaxase [Roseburia hominis]|uniref:Sel1 repeat family protein n=1 Tax=Roseburia hominis TaxID=301301 RepID=A0A395VFZ5_9FIRM|nr:MobP3 family relaxase [Roseburia hominis]RGS42402.1 sel1 repeat family protein [Roseburia hominis]